MSGIRIVRYAAWSVLALVLISASVVFWQWPDNPRIERVAVNAFGGPFTLTDQRGNTVTEVALKGQPSALFFGYTFCPDVCPTTLVEMSMWLEKLGPDADKLGVYFVTVDPERDTQELLAEYLTAFDPRITGLTGTPEAVGEIIEAYRVYAEKTPLDDGDYLMDHTSSIYLLDSDTAFTGTISYQEDPDTALAKLKRLANNS